MYHYKQHDAMDCGPACLAMVIKHAGRDPDIEQIRSDCALGREGVSLLGISKAAEKRGLHTLGGRITFEALVTGAPLPCIAHWGQNHFVVVYKVKRLRHGKWRIYVADPAKGLITFTQEEFTEHWVSTKTNGEEKGIVLLLEPTADFYAQDLSSYKDLRQDRLSQPLLVSCPLCYLIS